MYENLIKSLREAPDDWPDADLHYEAADAIENLQKKLCDWCGVCPKEKRNPSGCEILYSELYLPEPPKEEA